MSGVKTNTESENDGWPTNTTEISLGTPEIITHLQKMVLAPDYAKSPASRMDFGKARVNHDLADRLRDYYYATSDPRIAEEAHEHYQWALDLVNEQPLPSARIHYSQAVLYHHQSGHEWRRSGQPVPQLEHALRLAFSFAERLNKRKNQGERRFIAEGIHTMAANYGIDLFGNGEMKMAEIEARLWAMGNPKEVLGNMATEQTTEIIVPLPADEWREPRDVRWGQFDFDPREASEPLQPLLT